MERATTNIYEIVSQIQAKKEQYRIVPAHATFREIKEEVEGIDDGTLHALIGSQESNGLIRRVRCLNGYAWVVAEE